MLLLSFPFPTPHMHTCMGSLALSTTIHLFLDIWLNFGLCLCLSHLDSTCLYMDIWPVFEPVPCCPVCLCSPVCSWPQSVPVATSHSAFSLLGVLSSSPFCKPSFFVIKLLVLLLLPVCMVVCTWAQSAKGLKHRTWQFAVALVRAEFTLSGLGVQ